ncbi:jg1460 [Pararge aegeria aegeria]|uniref:Jg1460 protein n=1 Tax=Pararge aegeria aegeria TaxID=348720 RepID=A0A8S4QXL2_9NEOP|nr:jg1460 [Pararge aegeria aegeria]
MIKQMLSEDFNGLIVIYISIKVKVGDDGVNKPKADEKDNDFWVPIDNPRYPLPTHNPSFVAEKTPNDSAINAMIEIETLWKTAVGTANTTYSNTYVKLTIPLSVEVRRYCISHKEKFSVYDRFESKWLLKTEKDAMYDYCYDGKEFLQYDLLINDEVTAASRNRLLLCGKFTMMMQEPNLINAVSALSSDRSSFKLPKIDMIVGVPGCGKTTFILKEHKQGDLVLTSSAEGAADIRERLTKLKGGDSKDYKENYRTIDSYMLNSDKEYNVVWIDEALMKHPGELFYVCLKTKCNILHLLGDPNQIGYINRIGSVSVIYGNFKKFFSPSRFLRTSYKCPVDVMALLYSKYEDGTRSASSVVRSLTVKSYTSLSNVPLDNNKYKYLVFKQSEKELLKRAGYDVSTIHEFQGKQHKNIVIVRTSTKVKEEIYSSSSHILVAISRHTETLSYYTPVRDDLRKLLETKISTAELNRVKLDLRGGAINQKPEIVISRPVAPSNCIHVNNLILKTLDDNEYYDKNRNVHYFDVEEKDESNIDEDEDFLCGLFDQTLDIFNDVEKKKPNDKLGTSTPVKKAKQLERKKIEVPSFFYDSSDSLDLFVNRSEDRDHTLTFCKSDCKSFNAKIDKFRYSMVDNSKDVDAIEMTSMNGLSASFIKEQISNENPYDLLLSEKELYEDEDPLSRMVNNPDESEKENDDVKIDESALDFEKDVVKIVKNKDIAVDNLDIPNFNFRSAFKRLLGVKTKKSRIITKPNMRTDNLNILDKALSTNKINMTVSDIVNLTDGELPLYEKFSVDEDRPKKILGKVKVETLEKIDEDDNEDENETFDSVALVDFVKNLSDRSKLENDD